MDLHSDLLLLGLGRVHLVKEPPNACCQLRPTLTRKNVAYDSPPTLHFQSGSREPLLPRFDTKVALPQLGND